MEEINENDKLMAALCYPIVGVMSIIILLTESMKSRPFQKYHAVQSLVLWAVIFVVLLIISCLTLGFGFFLYFIAWLVSLWLAYRAYKGEYFEVPLITNFIKKQGWVA
jgi:uncharacterized membrane protein